MEWRLLDRLDVDVNIFPKEKRMIEQSMQYYGLNIINIKKVRSAYKVTCKEGTYCLKRMKRGKGKVKNGFILVEELNKIGFNKVAKYIKTKEGYNYVKYGKYILYLTDWIDGEEIKINDELEASQCAMLLAEFHNAVEKIDISELKIKNNLKNWPKIFLSNLYDLEYYKKLISRKRLINEFDKLYDSYIDILYERGVIALNILQNSYYYDISKKAEHNKTLCHDSFYYQNILKKQEEYYIVDLDSIIIDLEVHDLGKYIRRLMHKSDFMWDFEKAKCIIEAYISVRPLSKEELEVMLALIIFPHKFWKLGKKRYVKHKHYSEIKYMKKLEKIIRYIELQESFISKYIEYLENL